MYRRNIESQWKMQEKEVLQPCLPIENINAATQTFQMFLGQVCGVQLGIGSGRTDVN